LSPHLYLQLCRGPMSYILYYLLICGVRILTEADVCMYGYLQKL
jgi:hypothetical protein